MYNVLIIFTQPDTEHEAYKYNNIQHLYTYKMRCCIQYTCILILLCNNNNKRKYYFGVIKYFIA